MNNESSPLISIIVPVYNVKAYLERCLDSIRGQTYRSLEIIVVDDGSTDGSGDICDKYARLDNRIKVIHQDNAGQSAARNKALSVAQGEFLGFVDADDWIDRDMYEFLYNLILENHADISICSHYVEKQGKTKVRYSSGVKTVFSRNEAIRALVVDKRVRNYVWDKLFRRQLFNEIQFPEKQIFEDIAISYHVFYKANRVVMQDYPKYHYLKHEQSTTQGKTYNLENEYLLFLTIYKQVIFVQEKKIWNKAPIYLHRRGIHLIDHIMMLEYTPVISSVIGDVIAKMKEFDREVGFLTNWSFAIKKHFIYHRLNLYRDVYRVVRRFLKSKRYEF